MSRIRQITSKEEVSPENHDIFDAIAASRGRISGPFSVLLNSPQVAGRAAHLGSYLRFESTLSDADRELAIITTSREMDCDYEWSAHAVLAKQAGVSEEAIQVVAERKGLDSLTDNEALIVRYGRELLKGNRVSSATFEAAKARFGDQGVTELTATMGYYGMLACALNAFEVEPPADALRLP